MGGWYLNSALGMYTYMPYGGLMYSPFGYGFFSPGPIYSFYSPMPYTWYGGGGAPTASTGVPLSSVSTFTPGKSGVTGSQIGRLGSSAIHPTLGNPAPGAMITRSSAGSAATAERTGFSGFGSGAVSSGGSSSAGHSTSVSSGSMGQRRTRQVGFRSRRDILKLRGFGRATAGNAKLLRLAPQQSERWPSG